jgi:hypothetical protein
MTTTQQKLDLNNKFISVSEFISSLEHYVINEDVVQFILDLAQAKYSTYFSDEKNQKLIELDVVNTIASYKSFLSKCQTSQLLIKIVSIYFSKIPSAPCLEDDFV